MYPDNPKFEFNSDLLRKFLAKTGETQAWFAKKAKISPRMVTYLLNGKLPTVGHLMHISKVMDVKVLDVLIVRNPNHVK